MCECGFNWMTYCLFLVYLIKWCLQDHIYCLVACWEACNTFSSPRSFRYHWSVHQILWGAEIWPPNFTSESPASEAWSSVSQTAATAKLQRVPTVTPFITLHSLTPRSFWKKKKLSWVPWKHLVGGLLRILLWIHLSLMLHRVLVFLRDFHLVLRQDSEGFADNFKIDSGDVDTVVDLSHVFSGRLEGMWEVDINLVIFALHSLTFHTQTTDCSCWSLFERCCAVFMFAVCVLWIRHHWVTPHLESEWALQTSRWWPPAISRAFLLSKHEMSICDGIKGLNSAMPSSFVSRWGAVLLPRLCSPGPLPGLHLHRQWDLSRGASAQLHRRGVRVPLHHLPWRRHRQVKGDTWDPPSLFSTGSSLLVALTSHLLACVNSSLGGGVCFCPNRYNWACQLKDSWYFAGHFRCAKRDGANASVPGVGWEQRAFKETWHCCFVEEILYFLTFCSWKTKCAFFVCPGIWQGLGSIWGCSSLIAIRRPSLLTQGHSKKNTISPVEGGGDILSFWWNPMADAQGGVRAQPGLQPRKREGWK